MRFPKEEQALRVQEIFDFVNECTAVDIYRNMEDETLAMTCMVFTLAELAHLPGFLKILPSKNESLTLSTHVSQHL